MKKLLLLICLVPLLLGVKIRQDGCDTAYEQGFNAGVVTQYCFAQRNILELRLGWAEDAHKNIIKAENDMLLEYYTKKLKEECESVDNALEIMRKNKCSDYKYWDE